MKNKQVFSFTLKYLGVLKFIPLFPQVFDNLLKLWVFVTKPELLDWQDELETEILSWKGTSTSLHKYGGLQFNFKGKELGHLHSNGLLDVLYSRAIKQQLLDDGRVESHHVFKESGWISFYITNQSDRNYAIKLLRIAYKRRSGNLFHGKEEIATVKY